MIFEIAEIDVIAGHETAFEAGVAEAAPHFKAARGCRSFALTRGIEHPQRYRLTVGWDSVEDHMVHFRDSTGFQAWRRLVGPHFAAPPRVDHVERVIISF
ncbi:antibiotic biosynthesis monooxygenase [Sphingomonas sp. Leaf357]|uniref:putative quinol monooxygenase n=1 Tax=Sphingomonas sp. Leaf357 TaxID=1736350 RepID=UPI0006F52842|nr:antibiotic biosynthesis monooxygenase family protein [Sphingomonas sp. Leaf357]KQS03772.1 antibiotic biosynthesis monooxygenase [Sphingomonas sp. Leaf357]